MEKYTAEQIECAVEALMKAHDVMKDPSLLKAAQDKLKGVQKIKSIDDIRQASQKPVSTEKVEMDSVEMEEAGMDPMGNYGDPEENTLKGKTTLSSEDN